MAEQKNPHERPFSEGAKETARRTSEKESQKIKKSEQNPGQTENPHSEEPPHIPARSSGLCAIASVLLVIACLFLIRIETNRISAVRIDAGQNVTQAQVAEIVGSIDGKYLPSLDTARIEKKIKELSPMIADVKFQFSVTRRLTIKIIDEQYCYHYRTESGNILLLNSNFKALGYHPSDSCKKKDCPYEKGALTELYMKEPPEIVIGEVLLFEGKDELSSFVSELQAKKGTLYKNLNLLDIRNARHIVFIFDNLVCVELSESKDFDIKCLALEKMMVKRKTREEEIETRFTYVDPVSGSIYWAVEEWANLYEDYPNPNRP